MAVVVAVAVAAVVVAVVAAVAMVTAAARGGGEGEDHHRHHRTPVCASEFVEVCFYKNCHSSGQQSVPRHDSDGIRREI